MGTERLHLSTSKHMNGQTAMKASTFSAFGSGATVIALAFGFWTYSQDQKAKILLELSSRTADIRSNLLLVASKTEDVCNHLIDGAPMISGASSVAHQFIARLGPGATPKEFWHYYLNDDGFLLGVAIEGWRNSVEVQSLKHAQTELDQSTRQLTGSFQIFRTTGQLLESIIKDSYSALFVHGFFTDKEISRTIYDENRNKENIYNISIELSKSLQGNGSKYFLVRYYDATIEISKFVRNLTYALNKLEDKHLRELGLKAVGSIELGDMPLDILRKYLISFERFLGVDKISALKGSIELIERSITKEAAADRLESGSGLSNQVLFQNRCG